MTILPQTHYIDMDLKSKLNIYQKSAVEETFSTDENEDVESKLFTIGGEKIDTDFGEIWRFESQTNPQDDYFGINLDQLQKDIRPLLKHAKIDEDIELHELLFFDLETTSLNMGSGNYPFLCGIGYVDGKNFITEQLFMKDYSQEAAILSYLLDFFQKSKCVVSFNGKTFDMPLIKMRYRLNNISGFPVRIPVLDLIIPGRRIFKKVFENCALQTFEKQIIGFERVDDIPGWQIPQAYFEFQNENIFDPIKNIIEHNRLDIISMYVLLFIFSKIFDSLAQKKYDEFQKQSLFNLAKHLYNVDIEAFYNLAEYLGSELHEEKSVFEKYSIVLKRKNFWEKAIEYWKKNPSLFSLRELAKYYEHREKNYIEAMSFVIKSENLLKNKMYSENEKIISDSIFENYQNDLKKRKSRIEKKSKSKSLKPLI